MPRCEAGPVLWKGRRAFRLSNSKVEMTVLLGGGHIADFRLCGSPCNAVFEPPWQTIEPYEFSSPLHSAQYGDGPVGKFLSGYTGHAFVLGYFGMPNAEEAARGLPLHGEAASSEWRVISSVADNHHASLSFEVSLPDYQLRAQRTLHLAFGACSVLIEERVTNLGKDALDFQWVEHAAFGEPLFTSGEARLSISATQGRTWPLGYEGHELLPPNSDFHWPLTPTTTGEALDLSLAFPRSGKGFVAALLTDTTRPSAFVAVHNRRLNLAAGYVFDPQQFPWIALWEENRARDYVPWNGMTRARGVEFGTSPVPLGLQQALAMKTLFDTPVFTTLAAGTATTTAYHMFVTPVAGEWSVITDVEPCQEGLLLRGNRNQELKIPVSTAR